MLEFTASYPCLPVWSRHVAAGYTRQRYPGGGRPAPLAAQHHGWMGKMTPFPQHLFQRSPEGMLVLLVTSFIFLFISVYAVAFMKETEMQSEPIFIGCMLFFLGPCPWWPWPIIRSCCGSPLRRPLWSALPLIFMQSLPGGAGGHLEICADLLGGHCPGTAGLFLHHPVHGCWPSPDPAYLHLLNAVAPNSTRPGSRPALSFSSSVLGPRWDWLPCIPGCRTPTVEAPSPASALLSGALLNCAFLGVYRSHRLLYQAGLADFSSTILIGLGLLSDAHCRHLHL